MECTLLLVSTSVCTNLRITGWIFVKFDIGKIFKPCQFFVYIGHVQWWLRMKDACVFLCIPRSICWRKIYFETSCREKGNMHFMSSMFSL
jgi:hypothetical protein